LRDADVGIAKAIARELRSAEVRSLGLDLDGSAQVSCNLIQPDSIGPSEVYDYVSSRAVIERAELVGLLPRHILHKEPRSRWEQLDLSEEVTIEARMPSAGPNRGKI
jgi:hypothetical protein